MDGKTELNREEIIRLEGLLAVSYETISNKVKSLIEKYQSTSVENHALKENIMDLNNKITELKLQLNKLNSDSINKDKEISELKSMLLNPEKDNTSIRDKELVKSRLKELISRIDVHLEQYEDQSKEYDD